MKKIIFTASMLLMVSIVTFSQEEPEFQYYKNNEMKTLLGHDRGGGGYCSFSTGYSNINNMDAILFGGRFSWMASHSLGIGMGATGFINEFHYEPAIDRDVFLTGGYGGLYIEPVLLPRFPVHLSFPVLFGFGGISFISKDIEFNENFLEDSKAFLLIEPSAELELNLTRFLRLAIGASYRLPTPFDVGLPGSYTIDVESLRTLSYTVTLKLGKF
ncbi:MAG: hypothetical protein NTW82_06750 [Bacteroidia bacterium]|nr:hypothetical protein [Bacteroidia bacterium]